MSHHKPKAAKPSSSPKVADRPHQLTLAVAWAGLVFSLVSLGVTWWSLSETRRNNRINHQANVRTTVIFPQTIREQLRAFPADAVVKIPMMASIVNRGNTQVEDISFEYRITLNGIVLRDIKEKLTVRNKSTGVASPTSIAPGEESSFPMSVQLEAGTFLNAITGTTDTLSVCTQVSYRDSEGDAASKINCQVIRDEPPVVIVK